MDSGDTRNDLTKLGFAPAVIQAFAFLHNFGFRQIDALPTLVRYANDRVGANVYFGRSSFEIGFEIECEEERFPLSALISVANPLAAGKYRNFAATTPAAVSVGVARLADDVRLYATRALQGDPGFFAAARERSKKWSEEYALEVLAAQVRPQAEAAFREGRYREAAELYKQIATCLTPSERKKLEMARSRY